MNLLVEVTSPDPVGKPLSELALLPLGLDIWEVKPERLVLRAAEAQVERLSRMGYSVRQVEAVAAHVARFAAAADDDKKIYLSYQRLEEELRALQKSRPEIAELRKIGTSYEGRTIWGLRIGERTGGGQNGKRKPKILFMGCHHAREWISVEVPFRLARELINNSGDETIAGWLSKGEIWVVPMVNPDGHEFTRSDVGPNPEDNRLWRKTRRPNPDGSVGTDPNRNYGYMWGTRADAYSSPVPSDSTYVGPRAFSEPETQAIRDLIAIERFAGVVTYHSFSQLILYPWGYTEKPIADPADRQQMETLAKDMSDLIKGVHQKVYTPQKSTALYPTAGDTTDWTYGIYGIPSFTIELRPKTIEEGGFILPANQIEPTWEENRPAAFHLIERILGSEPATLFQGSF